MIHAAARVEKWTASPVADRARSRRRKEDEWLLLEVDKIERGREAAVELDGDEDASRAISRDDLDE